MAHLAIIYKGQRATRLMTKVSRRNDAVGQWTFGEMTLSPQSAS